MQVTNVASYIDANTGDTIAIVKVIAKHHDLKLCRSDLNVNVRGRCVHILRRWVNLRLTGIAGR